MMPDMDTPYVDYDPRIPGAIEIKFGDAWRARFVEGDELPADAPILHCYALVMMGERGYVTRRKGDDHPWWTVEGSLEPGETVEAWAKRAAQDQTGATAGKIVITGYLECRATSHNPDYEAGAIAVRPFLLIAAKSVDVVPEESGYERRRLPLNEYSTTLRRQYPAFDQHILAAIDRYLVMSRRGEV